MNTIDPVVLREQLGRNRIVAERASTTEAAARALLWFAEHAMSPNGPRVQNIQQDALADAPRLVASLTPDADHAQAYIKRAFSGLRAQVLERAIELAKADLQRAEIKVEQK